MALPASLSRRHALALLPIAATGGLLAACSSDDASSRASATSGQPHAPKPSVSFPADGTIIDVRTPEEYAQGHLEGAINIDVSSTGFDTAIDALDHGASYAVYCQSGNRSAKAAQAMTAKGFASVLDLGGYQEASLALGVPVIAG